MEAVEVAASPAWSGQTTSGVVVRVIPERNRAVEGRNRLTIAVEPAGQVPRTIDLVAPRMPMHGVVRVPVEFANGEWTASVEIPMAGEWIVYVNFDHGDDAAAIHFNAVAEDSVTDVSHHH